MRLLRAALLVVVSPAVALIGCGDSELQPEAVVTVSSPAPAPAEADAALEAWSAFRTAVTQAERAPFGIGERHSAAADFARFGWEPARTRFAEYIAGLAHDGVAFRGTPYVSHARVTAVRLGADPLPTVVITECLTGDDWIEYDVRTGRETPVSAPPPAVPPPYPGTIAVVRNGGRWGVSSVSFDGSRTCTG